MCVILAAEESFPSSQELFDADDTNRDGAGLAWVEGKKVCWKKGLTYEEVVDLANELSNPPALFHFRIATVGGTNKELTHPFPITEDVSLDLEGEADAVLMHNGHWSDWKDEAMRSATSCGAHVPDGLWSDSRAMAWLAAHHGIGILNFIKHQRIAVLTPEGIQRFGDWDKVSNGLWASNLNWRAGRSRHSVAGFRGGSVLWSSVNHRASLVNGLDDDDDPEPVETAAERLARIDREDREARELERLRNDADTDIRDLQAQRLVRQSDGSLVKRGSRRTYHREQPIDQAERTLADLYPTWDPLKEDWPTFKARWDRQEEARLDAIWRRIQTDGSNPSTSND